MAFYEANRRKLTKKTLSSILLNIRMIWSHVKKKYKKTFKNIWWFRKNAILLSFGEVAEWSIAAVLKTVELRGSGGSNPSLSALNSLQGVDFQPCRLFLCPKSCTKNAPTPFLRTSTGVFQIAHIPYIISHFLIPPDSTNCVV